MHPNGSETVAMLACTYCAPVSMLPALVKSACMPCVALHDVCLEPCCADDQGQVWVRQAICNIATLSQAR